MVGDMNKFAIANIALALLYSPLTTVVMAKESLGRHGRFMDTVIITASYAGVSAFIFPIAASVLTVVTQDKRFLLLDLVPPVVLGGCAAIIVAVNRIR
jgi:hypothetical protein